jgi:Carbamoyl-phosphate synthase L chain, ATP binding domain
VEFRKASVTPTILIAATNRWFATARLGIAFAKLGCTVEAICPDPHPLRMTRAVCRTHRYRGLFPLDSFLSAINLSQPNLIVAGDDLAIRHLQDLYYSEHKRNDKTSSRICELIERSIGSPESFTIVNGRASFLELANQEGILVPRTLALRDVGDLERWTSQIGFPVVLKADGSSSGEGVRIANTLTEAKHALLALQAPPQLLRVAKRALVGRDMRWIRPAIERRHSVVNAQEFIAGRDATSLVACWKGEVLAGLHFGVVKKQYERGPSSVLRLIENEEITNAIQKAVRRLNISGLHGFDFLLETGTEKAYLIEMNPRATQVGHLALGPGRDLPCALYAAVFEKPAPKTEKVTDNPTIALFPQEWSREPQSTFLNSAYHDIPWEEPNLFRYCLRTTQCWNDRRSLEEWIYIFSARRSSIV